MRNLVALTVALLLSATLIGIYVLPGRGEELVVASTTSLYDTGLLDAMSARVGEELSMRVKFIPSGTGMALKSAERGDVDAVLVHAPSRELDILREGSVVDRKVLAYNFFVIVGPKGDPVGIMGLSTKEALRRIAETGSRGKSLWISRGDGSGTNIKEESLWNASGFDPGEIKREDWYVESGSGMGNTLRLADEKGAYTLSDTGTYLRYVKSGLISLEPLVESERDLLNVYSVMAVSPLKHPDANFRGAMRLISWLTGESGQAFIEAYGKKEFGQSLFEPIVGIKGPGKEELRSWIIDYAFFNGSECPEQYRYAASGLYSGDGQR